MTPETHIIIVATVFGAIMGSFMNVLIYRLPRNESVVGGRSRCPNGRPYCRTFFRRPDRCVSWSTLRARAS